MRWHGVFVLFVLSAFTTAPLVGFATPHSPRWDDLRSKHSWSVVPEGWKNSGPPPIGTTIDLYAVLKPHQENALIHALYEVSTPGHPKYRVHLSREQVAELVAPHPDTLQLVHAWLEYRGVPSSSISVSHGGNSLRLSGVPVPRANDLLGASYQLFRNIKTNETIVRTLGYALPTALDGHVQVVAPTTSFDSPHPQEQLQEPHKRSGRATEKLAEGSGEPVTVLSSRDDYGFTSPSFLDWIYNTWDYSFAATDQNMLGIVSFSWLYPSLLDLDLFMGHYCSYGASAYFDVIQINNVNKAPIYIGLRPNIEMQYAQGMAYPTRHILYAIGRGQSRTEDLYLAWLEYIIDEPIIPQTILIPQGTIENIFSREYADFVCFLLAHLGTRGVTVVLATGDSGVGPDDCNDGTGKARFLPFFPATCPYVTSVGGTEAFSPEVATSMSGGGFSDFFPRPDYQQEAVSSFLQVETLENLNKGLYNESGRGIPDISAQASDFRVFFNGQNVPARGTSGSAAIVAGIISLLNNDQVSKGNHPLGFINPWLYGNGLEGLNDIKSGSNPGCYTGGFSATTGWDPVTGLGTLNFRKLLNILDPPPPPPDP